jgi:hypothetical protein
MPFLTLLAAWALWGTLELVLRRRASAPEPAPAAA